jgi:hypothetical protein
MRTPNLPTNAEVLQRFEVLKKIYVEGYENAQDKLSYLSSIEAIARNNESQGSAADMLESFSWNFKLLPVPEYYSDDLIYWPDIGPIRWLQSFASDIAFGYAVDDGLENFTKLLKNSTAPEHLKQSIVQRFENLAKRQELDDHVFIIRAIISQACLKMYKNLGDDFNLEREKPKRETYENEEMRKMKEASAKYEPLKSQIIEIASRYTKGKFARESGEMKKLWASIPEDKRPAKSTYRSWCNAASKSDK